MLTYLFNWILSGDESRWYYQQLSSQNKRPEADRELVDPLNVMSERGLTVVVCWARLKLEGFGFACWTMPGLSKMSIEGFRMEYMAGHSLHLEACFSGIRRCPYSRQCRANERGRQNFAGQSLHLYRLERGVQRRCPVSRKCRVREA